MLELRQETPEDHVIVEALVKAAFADEVFSDQSEHHLVRRLRSTPSFIPELSIVAELDDEIVGHILLSGIVIRNDNGVFPSLAMAPVSVLPAYQHQGIGGRLVRYAHQVAADLGHGSVVLLGHADYYPRFGYEPAAKYHISLPFEVPAENCMIIELIEGSLQGVSGMVEYPSVFFE
ncbi:MAG: N-acetyltransferase [Saprospiraceae bacterium]|nr:N-acetyltransferase [Lewinella sp.]